MPRLQDSLREHIAAAFAGIWVQSFEHEEAIREIAALCQSQKWSMAQWDIDRGLRCGNPAADASPGGDPAPQTLPATPSAADPLAALRALAHMAVPDSSLLLVLPNYHRFLGSPEIVQCLANTLQAGKMRRTFVIILAPTVQMPIELERQFVILEHPLPDRKQIQAIAQSVATEPGELPQDNQLEQLLDAAAGLTHGEAENAFSLSLVRHGRLAPPTIWELKTQSLRKSGLLTLHRGGESFDQLGGLEALKTFCLKALGASQRASIARPRGILLLGPPGSGKSQLCKALGNQTGRPTLIMDVGALLGSLVGQSESNVRRALAIADAMAPAVLMVDEVEKALSGSSNQGDSGVSARLLGSFLTWLSDHTSDVFVVCTSNDITRLPPEFSRAERFDGVFFCDLPTSAEKARIWDIYRQGYQLPEQDLPRSEQWTGAEIKSCCRLASLLELSLAEAAKQVVPVAVTAAESVERLRTWASGRCLSAGVAGLYQRVGATSNTVGRKVSRAASN